MLLKMMNMFHLFQDSLLSTFVNLTESIAPQPTYILCFPVTTGSHRKISSISDGTSSISSSPAGGSYYVISHSEAYEVDDSGMRRIKAELPTAGKEKKSAWTNSALQMPIGDQLAWPPIKKGFSFSLWLRLQNGSNSDWRLRRVRKSGKALVMKDDSSDSSGKDHCIIPCPRSVISNVQTPNLRNLSKNTPSKSL
jgi:hypothetical protein